MEGGEGTREDGSSKPGSGWASASSPAAAMIPTRPPPPPASPHSLFLPTDPKPPPRSPGAPRSQAPLPRVSGTARLSSRPSASALRPPPRPFFPLLSSHPPHPRGLAAAPSCAVSRQLTTLLPPHLPPAHHRAEQQYDGRAAQHHQRVAGQQLGAVGEGHHRRVGQAHQGQHQQHPEGSGGGQGTRGERGKGGVRVPGLDG